MSEEIKDNLISDADTSINPENIDIVGADQNESIDNTVNTEKESEITRRREEIEKYISSLSDADAFNNDSYHVQLDYFEGPLDLLLFLVKRTKIDITEIKISMITDQYISMMSQIDSVDLERATDFLEVAATLLEIKAKSVLPKPVIEVPDEDDPEKLLLRRLEEYKLYKEASKKMKEYETIGLHYRDPDKSVGKPRLVLADMNKDGLMEALRKMFMKLEQRAEQNKERSIVRDRFTVAEKINEIMEAFEENETYSFYELFDSDYNKSEIITTFQAMLELLKNQFFIAEQSEIFGDIILKKVREVQND